MPNHIHLVIRLEDGKNLARVLQSLKSFTSHAVNRYLEKNGALWEREYFDRIVRSGRLHDCIRYVLNNPKKAGLIGWPWVGVGEPPALQQPLPPGNDRRSGALRCPQAHPTVYNVPNGVSDGEPTKAEED
jgi:hypothetical protein